MRTRREVTRGQGEEQQEDSKANLREKEKENWHFFNQSSSPCMLGKTLQNWSQNCQMEKWHIFENGSNQYSNQRWTLHFGKKIWWNSNYPCFCTISYCIFYAWNKCFVTKKYQEISYQKIDILLHHIGRKKSIFS